MSPDIGAIVLAAGRGTRFGEAPKMLAVLAGRPLVRHVAEAALAGRLRPVLVVVGHRAEEVGAALDGLPVALVENPAFAEGLSTSLKAGAAALPAGLGGAFVLLGDMPLVGAGLIGRLAEAWREAGQPAALVPTYGGKRGNPVLLGRAILDRVGTLSGDAGAGPLLKSEPGILAWPVDDPAVAVDIDTPEALAAAADGQASTTPFRMAE